MKKFILPAVMFVVYQKKLCTALWLGEKKNVPISKNALPLQNF
jgi:hypothetical protein